MTRSTTLSRTTCIPPEDLDDLLTTIGTQGIDVLEGPKLPSSALDKKFDEEEAGEDVELDLTPGRSGKNQRSRPHVFARDGNRAPAHPRRRS